MINTIGKTSNLRNLIKKGEIINKAKPKKTIVSPISFITLLFLIQLISSLNFSILYSIIPKIMTRIGTRTQIETPRRIRTIKSIKKIISKTRCLFNSFFVASNFSHFVSFTFFFIQNTRKKRLIKLFLLMSLLSFGLFNLVLLSPL